MAWPSRSRRAARTIAAASRSLGSGARAVRTRHALASHTSQMPHGWPASSWSPKWRTSATMRQAVAVGVALHLVELLLLVLALPLVGRAPAVARRGPRLLAALRRRARRRGSRASRAPSRSPRRRGAARRASSSRRARLRPQGAGTRARAPRARGSRARRRTRGCAGRHECEQHGAAGLAVAAGAADLLVVALDAAGQGRVDHRADVGLVDAHAEGDRRHDHLELAGQERGLDASRAARSCPRGTRRRRKSRGQRRAERLGLACASARRRSPAGASRLGEQAADGVGAQRRARRAPPRSRCCRGGSRG